MGHFFTEDGAFFCSEGLATLLTVAVTPALGENWTACKKTTEPGKKSWRWTHLLQGEGRFRWGARQEDDEEDGKQVESDNIEDEQRWNDHGGTAEELDAAAAEDAAAQTDDPSRCERVRIRRQRRREDKSIARACGEGGSASPVGGGGCVVAAVDVAGDGNEVDGEAPVPVSLKNAIHFLESAGLEASRAEELLSLSL